MSQEKEKNQLIDGLMRRRTVVMVGEINRDSIEEIGTRLLQLQLESSDPIYLLIDSEGGEDVSAFALCDLMTNIMVAPVHGIAFGTCSSAATFVMLHCTERWGTQYSRYLIHSGTSSISLPVNQSTAAKVEELLRDLKRDEERVIQMYMSKLKKTRKNILQLIARGDQSFDQYLNAYEAKKVGLITRIIDGKLPIFQ